MSSQSQITPQSSFTSFTTSQAQSSMAPAVSLPSPAKKRKLRGDTYSQSDAEAWDLPDKEIIDVSLAVWDSDAYPHYITTIERDTSLRTMTFHFACKYGDSKHAFVYKRERGKTSTGTSNMLNSASKCDKRNGRYVEPSSESRVSLEYSPLQHRVIIAMRCATSHRPFNIVTDKYYQAEVELLRPQTSLPHPTTVSADTKYIYVRLSAALVEYFKTRGRALHLAMDGWTSPNNVSYMGVVIIWVYEGKLYRCVLEYIKLTKSHTGQNLAKEVWDCLKHFGMSHLLHVAFNRIAKAFLSFFYRVYKRKKVVQPSSSVVRTGPQANTLTSPAAEQHDIVLEAGETLGKDESEVANVLAAEEGSFAPGDGRAEHDEVLVKSIRGKAIIDMKAKGVVITAAEQKSAEQILSKVSSLAVCLRDSTMLGAAFTATVDQQPDHSEIGDKSKLDTNNATRWNTELNCLKAHVLLRNPVEQLTGVTSYKLGAFRLTPTQWDLTAPLLDALKIFEAPTLLFQRADVPLVPEAIPMLEKLEKRLRALAEDTSMPNVIRVAAYVGLSVAEKYHSLTDDCEVYHISIAMCPDHKLVWFKKRGWSDAAVKEVKALVVRRWEESYQAMASLPTTAQSACTFAAAPAWRIPDSDNEEDLYARQLDHIQTCLEDPPIPTEEIDIAGGYLKYWDSHHKYTPSLAAMGEDFCSAPASSTDAERSFSDGCLDMNHLQHNMSSSSFQARMALGSWDGTPFCNDIQQIFDIMDSKPTNA